jgi:lysophospholipase L1-like esterase
MTTKSSGLRFSKVQRTAVLLLSGTLALGGLALAARPGGGGGGGGGKTAKPAISVSPTSLSFGEIVVATPSAAQSVSVKNSGKATLNISGITISNPAAGFAFTRTCGTTLAAGATCSVNVTFTPAGVGAAGAGLVIVSDASNATTFNVALSGTGKSAPAVAVRRAKGGGDSIMRGYNASCTRNDFLGLFCYSGGDQPENSFMDGSSSSVLSLVDRYIQIDPLFTGDKNASASGSEMIDGAKNNFATQAAAIVGSATQPTRVFIELGGNDLCNRTTVNDLYPVATWEAAVGTGLRALVDGLPDGSTVMMVSVPRVQDLRAAGILKQQATSGVNCQSFWSTFGVCRIATADGGDLSTRLAAIEARQTAYNEALVALAAAYNAEATTTGVEVVTDYDPNIDLSVGSYRFQPDDINGGDCFHPSIQGQNRLSEVIWNKNPHR